MSGIFVSCSASQPVFQFSTWRLLFHFLPEECVPRQRVASCIEGQRSGKLSALSSVNTQTQGQTRTQCHNTNLSLCLFLMTCQLLWVYVYVLACVHVMCVQKELKGFWRNWKGISWSLTLHHSRPQFKKFLSGMTFRSDAGCSVFIRSFAGSQQGREMNVSSQRREPKRGAWAFLRGRSTSLTFTEQSLREFKGFFLIFFRRSTVLCYRGEEMMGKVGVPRCLFILTSLWLLCTPNIFDSAFCFLQVNIFQDNRYLSEIFKN